MPDACSSACGYCGRCTSKYERDDDDTQDSFVDYCYYCNRRLDDETYYPFCSKDCRVRAAVESEEE